MLGRAMEVLLRLGALALFLAGGVGVIWLSSLVVPIGEAVRASGGLVGFLYGLLLMLGGAAVSTIFWIVAGKSLTGYIVFGDW